MSPSPQNSDGLSGPQPDEPTAAPDDAANDETASVGATVLDRAASSRSPALDGTGQSLPMRQGPMAHFRSAEPAPEPPAPSRAGTEGLPERYEIRDTDEGRVLVCKEAPGLFVRMDRGFAFSEQEARRLGERTILLDGAGTFAPLVDDAAHLYNLDHHEGCLRAFTLASCEQALVLVLKGLELDRGDWSIYANEPDLDTVFAVWVLLNYRRIRDFDDEARDRIVPLLRLEGAIDANGFEVAEYCGLTQSALRREKARLDRLMRDELDAKRSGVWSKSDPVEYTRSLLLELDHMVYRPSDFRDFASVEEEYGHVDIGGGRVAVVCRDGAGIYDVERRLKKVWGDRLGIIALEREPQQYTLRRAASLSGIDLGESYERLNLLDPAVDGRPPSKRWGGSEEIGGSPRPSGTGLTPREIGKILKLTYRKVAPVERLQKALAAISWALFVWLLGGLAVAAWRIFEPYGPSTDGGPREVAVAAAVVTLGSLLATWRLSRGWTWIYGWRLPAGVQGWLLTPLILAAGAAGGSLLPLAGEARATWLLGAALAASLAVELSLRGLVHGQLVLEDRLSTVGTRWFLSRPTLVAAVAHCLVVPPLLAAWLPAPQLPWETWINWLVVTVAAFAAGLCLGLLRERTLSLWPGVLLLFLGAVVRWLTQPWLAG